MNKDKAIQLLERLQDPEPYEPMLTKDAYDAIQMAIDALSADGDTISRQAVKELLNNNGLPYHINPVLWKDLNELPPVQPEQLEQCPIYGGMCAYPSGQCYDCPRHAGAKMEVTT